MEETAVADQLDAGLHFGLRVDPGHDRRIDHSARHLPIADHDIDGLWLEDDARSLHRTLSSRSCGIGLQFDILARSHFQLPDRIDLASSLHSHQAAREVVRSDHSGQLRVGPSGSNARIQMQIPLRGDRSGDDDRRHGIGQHRRSATAVVVLDDAVHANVVTEQLDRTGGKQFPAARHQNIAASTRVDQPAYVRGSDETTIQDVDLRGIDVDVALRQHLPAHIQRAGRHDRDTRRVDDG